MAYTREDLKYLQSLPLEIKIQKSIAKIIECYVKNDGKVYVSFSGGIVCTRYLNLKKFLI